MPGVRESGKNWTFSTFQADEKLGAVSRGGTLQLLGFLFTRVCINTWHTVDHPMSFDVMLCWCYRGDEVSAYRFERTMNGHEWTIPGSSKRVKFVPFHPRNLPKGRNFTYMEDPGIYVYTNYIHTVYTLYIYISLHVQIYNYVHLASKYLGKKQLHAAARHAWTKFSKRIRSVSCWLQRQRATQGDQDVHFDLMKAVEEINDANVLQALEAGANPESWLWEATIKWHSMVGYVEVPIKYV